jgi:quercetin dioxygenase-like cupin family protein
MQVKPSLLTPGWALAPWEGFEVLLHDSSSKPKRCSYASSRALEDPMEGHTYLRTHDLAAEHTLLDLGKVVTELHGTSTHGPTRGGVTLVKEDGMSIVLTHLHAGGTMNDHGGSGPTSLLVLDGCIRVEIDGKTVEVPGGRLFAFTAGVRHSVQAIEDSTLLLTIAAKGDPGIGEAMEPSEQGTFTRGAREESI